MSHDHFSASVRPQDGVAVIDLQGEINGTSEEALNRAYVQAISQQPSAVLLNFAQVDYINSTGIALIVGLLAQARKTKHPLMTYGLSSHYQEIFRITRLSDFMGMFNDEASALKSVKRET